MTKLAIASAMMALFVTAVVAQDAPMKSPGALVAEAKTDLDQGMLADAQEKLRQAIQLDPKIPAAYVEMARLEMKANGVEGDMRALVPAERWIEKAIELDPNYGDAYVLQGYVYTHENRLDDAGRAFAKATQLQATSPWLPFNRAEMNERLGKTTEAMTDFASVGNSLSLPSQVRVNALYKLAGLYEREKNYTLAKQAYLQLLELNPSAALMGDYSLFLRRDMLAVDEAEDVARKAFAIAPQRLVVRNLALALYLKWADDLSHGRREKAQAEFDEAQRLGVDLKEILSEIGAYPKVHPILFALRDNGISLDGQSGATTPLTMALSCDNNVMIEALLNAGVNPNIKGYSMAPLILAAARSNKNAVNWLLSHGADPWVLNDDRLDGEAIAQKNGNAEIAALVRQAKAAKPRTAGTGDALVPFRTGYVYRIISELPSSSRFVGFDVGSDAYYTGSHSYGKPLQSEFGFRNADGSHVMTWSTGADKISDWSKYFKEIGPAPPKR